MQKVFDKWDKEKKGYLTIEDYLEFYKFSCIEKPDVVWSNLHHHHYKNNLKKESEVEEIQKETLAKFF